MSMLGTAPGMRCWICWTEGWCWLAAMTAGVAQLTLTGPMMS